ncbi:MAG TPA: amino acid ABC transporter permease [Alphaproteobacteria bacterium]|nr:amino acid ABC transporter permease [Alphaproteobacteria bacterium]
MTEAAQAAAPAAPEWRRLLLRLPTVLLIALIVAVAAWIDLGNTLLGRLTAPLRGLFGWEAGSGGARLLTGLVLAGLLAGNFALLRRLPFGAQVGIVWAELLALSLAFFDSFDLSYAFILQRLPILIGTGAVTTIYVSAAAIVCASILALVAALGRLSHHGPSYAVATFYISFFRGTPLLLQVYLIYLGLPQLGLTLDAVPSGILALSLCYGAYMAEIFRAGIEGVPKGQTEAARALGLRPTLIMRLVVLPQALKLVIPPIGNQFIAMLKDSALVSVMGVWELMFLARTQGRAEFRNLEMLIAAALIYWILSLAFEIGQARLERHFGKGDRR